MFVLTRIFSSRVKDTEFLGLVEAGMYSFSFPFDHDLIFLPLMIESVPPLMTPILPPGEDLYSGEFLDPKDPWNPSRLHKFWDYLVECVLYGNFGCDGKGNLFGVDATQQSSE
jgi:hypothetical protein